jgi:NAD(P)-dependent dehydrogenase (short-subunit alcohol dehydrogenase family)
MERAPVAIVTAGSKGMSPDAAYVTGQNIRVDGGLTRSV